MTDNSAPFDRDDVSETENERVADHIAAERPDLPPLPAQGRPRARRIGFLILGAIVLIAAIAYGVD